MNAPVGVADTDRIRNMRAHYMDKVALIDRYVAELVQALEKRGLLENTVIIFTLDHGDCLGDFGIVDKRYFYEGSAGVPFFMCGPGVPHEERKNGPRVSRMLISHLDLYPTVCALAGAENPRDKRRSGCDIVAMLKGDAPGHTEIIGELATEVMVRTGNWKLVYDPEQGGVQNLYNLARDPNEEENLAGGAGYENVTLDLVRRLLDHKVRQTQSTHIKEEQRLQRVHIPG
ncbi:sulfatase-like hydrolase/transferase [bacterium]|nr:sulfatase-like hydrolase/transferase [bacterium]